MVGSLYRSRSPTSSCTSRPGSSRLQAIRTAARPWSGSSSTRPRSKASPPTRRSPRSSRASTLTTGRPHRPAPAGWDPHISSSRSTRGANTRSSGCSRPSAIPCAASIAAAMRASLPKASSPESGVSSATKKSPRSASSLVEREHGEHDVDRDERPPFERDRLAVAGDLPDGERHQHERPDVHRREHERQPVLEEEREQHERREEEDCDLSDGVLDHGDREVGSALRRQGDADEVLDRVTGDRNDYEPGERLRDPE